MASWGDFACAQPGLAGAIYSLVHQYGPGLGYLATVRPDGGPRVHPVAPVIIDGGLYCFLIDSPKRRDLERDRRYALHAFPPENSDDEAYLAGTADPVTDRERIRRMAQQLRAEPRVDWRLFEFGVDVAMVVRRSEGTPFGGPGCPSDREVWRDTSAAAR